MDDPASIDLCVFCASNRLLVLAGDLAMSATELRRPEPTEAGSRHPWARRLGRVLSGILVLASVLLGYFVYRLYYANPRTDDAYVHANTAARAAHVSGQIVQLPIRDNHQAKNGGVLFVVRSPPYNISLD